MYYLDKVGEDWRINEDGRTICIIVALDYFKTKEVIDRLNNTDTEQRHAEIRTQKFIKGDNK